MASKIRSMVATVDFDNFHRNSAKLIRKAIFGVDELGKIRDEYMLPTNLLTVTNVDIKNVVPIDEKTKESLLKTVTLAIEITTNRQEAGARFFSTIQTLGRKGRTGSAERTQKTTNRRRIQSGSCQKKIFGTLGQKSIFLFNRQRSLRTGQGHFQSKGSGGIFENT